MDTLALRRVIQSYLYQQYADDEDLQAFVDQFNQMAQDYLDTLNGLHLPIYTSDPVSGELLDWVAAGLYDFVRPALPNPAARFAGAFNTFTCNSLPFNAHVQANPDVPAYLTDDDLFRRVITWHFFKGDGTVFTVDWLKRRIARFLFADNGLGINVDQTYQISVSFLADRQVNINIVTAVRRLISAARFNGFAMNTLAFNQVNSTVQTFPAVPYLPVLQAAVEGGILELPFQYTFNVNSGSLFIV